MEIITNKNMTKKYKEYLKSEEWKNKRKTILERDKYKCALCGVTLGKRNENIHHITYKNIYKENNKDLISLCRNCHQEYHQQDLSFNKYLKNKQKELEENKKKERYILMEGGDVVVTNKAITDRIDNSNSDFIVVDGNLLNKNFITCVYDIYDKKEMEEEKELLFPEVSGSFFDCV